MRVSNAAWHSLQSTAVPAINSPARGIHTSCATSWQRAQFIPPAYRDMYASCGTVAVCQLGWSSRGYAHNCSSHVNHKTILPEGEWLMHSTCTRASWARHQANVAVVNGMPGASEHTQANQLRDIQSRSSVGPTIVGRSLGVRTVRCGPSLGGIHGALQGMRSIHASSLQADSVLRKRRSKMKRHKWKKRQRLLRRKSKVSQGAKR